MASRRQTPWTRSTGPPPWRIWQPAGLHVHLGSQIRDLRTYLEAVGWLANLIDQNGLGELGVLDLGGGLAVAHTAGEQVPDIATGVTQIVLAVAEAMAARGLPLPELVLEPGRSIVGPTGVTLYSVGAIKQVESGTTYAAVDGGMSDNPRPTLYAAKYQALVADRADAPAQVTYTIAGKHCETGDVLIERAELPQLAAGDVLAVAATGAYTASMASNYNAIPRPAAVMVEDGTARQIVRRETIADLLQPATNTSGVGITVPGTVIHLFTSGRTGRGRREWRRRSPWRP